MKPRRTAAAAAALAAGCLALAASPAWAGVASSSFNVTVQLTSSGSGVCGSRGSAIGCGGGSLPPVVVPPVVVVPPIVVVTPPVVVPPVVTPPVTPPVDPPVAGGGSQPPVVIPPTVTPPIIVTPGGTLQPPVTTSPFRFVAAVSRSGDLLGTVDIYSGSGTVTAWRVVNFGDREYLEMTLGW